MGETLDKMIDVLADKADTKKYKKSNGLDAIEEDDEYWYILMSLSIWIALIIQSSQRNTIKSYVI